MLPMYHMGFDDPTWSGKVYVLLISALVSNSDIQDRSQAE